MNESEKKRLTILVDAIWINGFWCEHCKRRATPWLRKRVKHHASAGWRAQCPVCNSEVSLCDKRIGIIMKAGMNAVMSVAIVCFVYRISFRQVLTKDKTVRNLNRATCAMIRELEGAMLDSEIMQALSVDSKKLREARSKSFCVENVWKTAAKSREEARQVRERKREKRAGRREQTNREARERYSKKRRREVADRKPNGKRSKTVGRSGSSGNDEG